MKIGTDMNLRTCYAEGYLMMEFKKRELFPKHLKGKMDKDCWVNFTATGADYTHTENGYPKRPGSCRADLLFIDVGLTFNILMEMYEPRKEAINQFSGITHEERGLDNPNEYTFLWLASDVNAYCGLE